MVKIPQIKKIRRIKLNRSEAVLVYPKKGINGIILYLDIFDDMAQGDCIEILTDSKIKTGLNNRRESEFKKHYGGQNDSKKNSSAEGRFQQHRPKKHPARYAVEG